MHVLAVKPGRASPPWRLLWLVLPLLLGCRGSESDPGGGPNVLLIVADQLRASALSTHGNEEPTSPHLDRLGRRGAVFENAYAVSPVCSPSRAQLLTGKISGQPATSKSVSNRFLYKLPLSETTIAEILQQQGYATGYAGKWHLSPDGGRRDGFVPVDARQGFGEWFATELPHGHYDGLYYTDSPEPVRTTGFASDRETDWGLGFIERNRERPFFLVISWNPPHPPYTPPPEYDRFSPDRIELRPNVPAELEEQARRDLGAYYGLVAAMDANVGRLLDGLDRLGLSEDTIVLFTSDHGDMLHSHGVEAGRKRAPYEEASHVPLLVSYPPRIRPGARHGALIGTVDVAPTLLALAGLDVPGWMEGRDFTPLLAGEPFEEPAALFLHFSSTNNAPLGAPWRAIRTREWLFARSLGVPGGDWLLFDLANDPCEMNNLIDAPEHEQTRSELRDLLRARQEALGDDLLR